MQERVAVLAGLKRTVPELWVKVPPVMVNLFETVMVPEGAVKLPELRVNFPLRSKVV